MFWETVTLLSPEGLKLPRILNPKGFVDIEYSAKLVIINL